MSPTLPPFAGHFDDVFEIPLGLITGNPNQSIAVNVVEPGSVPVRATRKDTVLAEKVFRDEVPWIVVSLVETPEVLFSEYGLPNKWLHPTAAVGRPRVILSDDERPPRVSRGR